MTPQMLAGLLSAHGQGNPVVTGRAAASVSETLRPLELLDLPEIYGQHAALIDFLLFFLLFNGFLNWFLLFGRHNVFLLSLSSSNLQIPDSPI